MLSREARSRSPRGDGAAAGILRTLDVEKMQLKLEARVAKVMYFKEDDIWFEAKPLVLYLEYSSTNVTQTLGLVKEKNKKSLKELLETRGQPKGGDLSDKYHELKALYINEPGLYSLIFRSTKKQAQDFQDWVYEEVLTALRRRGSYQVPDSPQMPPEAVAALGQLVQDSVSTSSSAAVVSVTTAAATAAPSLAVAAPKVQPRALKAPEEHFLFVDVVKQRCKLKSAVLKDVVRMAYASFLNLVATDEERSVTSVSQELKDASFGLKAIVPQKWLPMAVAAIEASSTPVGSAVPTGDIERAPPEPPSSSRKRKLPFFSEKEHALAKDAANLKWLQLVEVGSQLFFLDSWCDKEGLKLRTTAALLQAGHSATKLFSANPDEGIVRQLGLQGVSCHHGTWAESPARKYDGIYLDLCSGSEAYVRDQFEVSTMRSNAGCVLAWTLTARDFNGEPLILRAYGLHDSLRNLGWKPAAQQHKSSALLHRSGGSGQQVLTEFWVKG